MKDRTFMLIFILLALVTILGCSNDSNSTDKPNELNLPENNQTELSAEQAEEIKVELIKTFDEKHERYNFAYKRSTYSVRKEIFDDSELTDEHIIKFFETLEIVYDKLNTFFPREQTDYIKTVAYHSIPTEWSEPDLYDDYSEILHLYDTWALTLPGLNSTLYHERVFEARLKDIDIGLPAIVGHELGHVFTMSPADSERYYYVEPYVWDTELFADLAMMYLGSEFSVKGYVEGMVTSDSFQNESDLHRRRFFALAAKYGYDAISDTFKEMIRLLPNDIDLYIHGGETQFELFKQVLSQKTGDDIDHYFSDLTDAITVKESIYDISMTQLTLGYLNLEDSDIESLKNMVNLTSLNLTYNQISDISALANLTGLMELHLGFNQIKDISALAGLKNLTNLQMPNNQINDISVVAGMNNLTVLNLTGNPTLPDNKISDISVLSELTNLTELYLANNKISDISALTGLTNLTILNLIDNPISEEQIAELRKALPYTKIFIDITDIFDSN